MTLLLLSVLPGCSTVDTRIGERAGAFAALPAEAQQRLREGRIVLGDSKDMVYIALGRPDVEQSRVEGAGVVLDTWSYSGVYYTTDSVWYSSRHRRGSSSDHPFGDHYHGPEYVDVQHEYEALRLEFEQGKVKAIERMRR